MTEQTQPVEQQEGFSPETFMGETPETPETPETQTPEVPEVPEAPTSDEVQFDEYFSAFREEVGELNPQIVELFKNGKDAEGNPLTPKMKLNILKDSLLDNVLLGGDEDHDAFIRDYMASVAQPDFDRAKWLDGYKQSQDYLKMPSKDFLKTYYKNHSEINKLNWSESDINAKVDGMNNIDADMEAQRVKGFVSEQMKVKQQKQAEQEFVKYEQEIKERLAKDNDSIQKDLTNFIASAQAKKVIGGFEFGDADKKEFLAELPKFMERKVVTLEDGRKFIASDADMVLEEIKAKPEMSLNMLPFLYLMKKGKLDGYMSRIIEGKKKQLEETLEDTPGTSFNRGGSDTPGFDPNQFMGG